MKLSLVILTSIALMTTQTHTMGKFLALLRPLDEERIENYLHGYQDVFEATTPTVTFNKAEYQRTPLPNENNYERIRLAVPLFLIQYVIELRRKQIYSNTKEPTFEYLQTYKGYQLTIPGKIVAGFVAFALFRTLSRRWLP